MIVSLQHAIYGSASGLADYRILAASEGVDEATRREIARYSSLGGSAMAEAFDPIFSFFALGSGRWAFSRTIHLTPTTRGSDYLVHAILLNEVTLARHDFKPFVFSDAGLFVGQKPPLHAQLKTLEWSDDNGSQPLTWPVDPSTIALLLRGLAKGPLRLRVPNDTNTVAICRAAHEALPPSDRMKTTFCTRFSYRSALNFRIATFVDADAAIVAEQNSPGTSVVALLSMGPATNDAFSRWVADVTGKPELELFGPSILNKPGDALESVENVRQLRRWTRGGEASNNLRSLLPAAALVLRPENCDRASIRPLLPGALALKLCDCVAKTLTIGGSFDECAQLARDFGAEVRAGAAQWIGQLPVARREVWLAKILLMLPDAPLAEIIAALRESGGGQSYVAELSRDAAPFRAFLAVVMASIRDRFGANAAKELAQIMGSLEKTDAPMFIGLMEAAVRKAPNNIREAWLLAIIRDIAQPAELDNAVARLVLTYGLAARLTPDEITRHGRAFIEFSQQLERVLRADPPAALIAALGSAFSAQFGTTRWQPDDAATETLRITISLMTDLARRGGGVTPEHLTLITFLSATCRQDKVRASVRDAVVDAIVLLAQRKATPVQAALLLRALQSLPRGGSVRLQISAARLLRRAARRRNPKSLWNVLRRHLRLRTLLEAQAS